MRKLNRFNIPIIGLTFEISLNVVIEGALSQVSSLGVFYVDGWQVKFDGHRYCEPGTNLWDPTGDETWFFSRHA